MGWASYRMFKSEPVQLLEHGMTEGDVIVEGWKPYSGWAIHELHALNMSINLEDE